MKPILVFDMDDTLYAEHDYVRSGFQAVAQHLERVHRCPGFYEEAMTLFNAGNRGRIFNEGLARLGHDADAALIQELLACYRNHTPRIALADEVVDLLRRLRQDYCLGLITDGYEEVQRHKVAALNLPDLIDEIVMTGVWGRDYWKPHPRAYETIMQAFNAPGSRCTYVGDNPKKDFVTARRLGWHTVQLLRAGGEYSHYQPEPGYQADHVIASLGDLTDLLPLEQPS